MIQTTTTKQTYNGNGVLTKWEYSFPISTPDGSDIQVWLTNPEGVDSRLTTNFSVNVASKFVKYPTAESGLDPLPLGWKITLLRVSTLTQVLDLINQGAFNAENIEDALDKLTMISQQLQEQISRSLKVGVTESEGNPDALMDEMHNAVDLAKEAQGKAEEAQGKAEEAQGKAKEAQGKAEEAQGKAEKAQEATENALGSIYPSLYQRDQKWVLKTPYTTAANRYTILTPNKLSVDINGTVYFLTAQAEIDLSLEASWDTISGTDYRTAANRAGKDFYIYACVPGSGSAPTIKVSANSTTPSGYSASTSRKIGGFHGLCVAVGTISGHTLTDFVAGDVLPASIWDLLHRPVSNPEGMVYSDGINKWVDIYLASGTGTSTASVYAATITDTRDWNDFVDDGGAVKKKMLTDPEFQIIAAGSNEATNINGSGDPGTTGGHVDTASRRMISNIGVEDACGVEWQWLDEQTMMYDAAVTADWYDLPGDKGKLWRPIYSNDVKLLAGGDWGTGVRCGSRGRHASNSRWDAGSLIGCRFCAEPV